jgi:outer membrane protein assembly factor BamB
MSSPGPRRARWIVAGLLVAIGVAVAVIVLSASGSPHHPRPHLAAKPPAPPKPKPPPVPVDSPWLFYGYNQARTRFFPRSQKLDPPFRRGWTFRDYALLEFPPVIYHNTLYFEDYYGHAKAISALTGRPIWQRGLGTLAAASPALDIRHQLAFFVLLSTIPNARLPANGRVVAVSMKTGKVVWAHRIGPGSETSPLVHGQSVIIGDQGGTVYSYRTSDGHLNWTFHASGSVKGGIAYAGGRLYFGDYGGHVYALNEANGHEIWSASGGDTFYSTPAVAFGRVYIGNTNGDVYAFSTGSGALSWRAGTGAYVYASPAVANVPGLGPTVYEGSYDGNMYAYNAFTGAVRWSHPAGGRINGSATIVGNLVYYSILAVKTSAGLDLRTGRKVFSWKDGEFTPVVADGRSVFLVGYSTIYQLLPRR